MQEKNFFIELWSLHTALIPKRFSAFKSILKGAGNGILAMVWAPLGLIFFCTGLVTGTLFGRIE